MQQKLDHDTSILIAGARGMVGSALIRSLKSKGLSRLLTPSRSEVDFRDQQQVRAYLGQHRPDLIIIAAAKVGGIFANATYQADFLYENLMIASNLIHEAHSVNTERLLFLGSTCIYPKFAPQPISESALLSGPLEPTNEGYAIAKIAGVKLCEFYRKQYGRSYISAMPTNLYGPGDNYHPENSHVLPALLRRFHEAKLNGDSVVTVWGSGSPRREFLHVDDLAEACLFLLESYDEPEPINVGSAEELTIGELAYLIAEVVEYRGEIFFDSDKPDGTPRKKSDSSKINRLGWSPRISLKEGIQATYKEFVDLCCKDTLSLT